MLYTPWLTTLDYVRRDRRMPSATTQDDALLQQFIAERSQEFQEAGVGRTCIPYVATRLLDYESAYRLRFDDDLLAVTTLTNGDSATVSSTDYLLEPANIYPKWRLVMKRSASTLLTYSTESRQSISLAGIWGYVPNYASCWPTSGVTCPALTSSDTSAAVSSGAAFETGQYIKIDSEVIQITAIATNTLTLSRAELGTTAAIHTLGTVIYKFRIQPDIQGAVTEMVRYSYMTKDQAGGRVQIFSDGIMQVQDIDPRVKKTAEAHKRRRFEVLG